jgi:copper resistance protein C
MTMRIGNRRRLLCGAIAAAMVHVGSGNAWGHAFPVRAVPGAGATVHEPPPRVEIAFDHMLEPMFSNVRVEDAGGKQIAQAAATADRPDASVLEVKLPALSPGVYHVWWTAVARDGHRTVGDYTFTLQ